jgi:type I restriction enzyme, S subunit
VNPADILDNFDRITEGPDAIQLLRKLIMVLAIGGRFNSGAEPSSETRDLLKEIEVARRATVSSGSSVRDDSSDVNPDDVPVAFPNPKQFIRLGFAARIEKGLTGIKSAAPGPYPLVVTAEERLSCDHFDFEGPAAVIPLVSSTGHGRASLHRLHYQEAPFALGTILAAVLPHAPDILSARFLFEYLGAFKEELLVSKMLGTANVSLTIGKIADVPVPLVPRSVRQKVDELMALCDRLESAQTERERRRDLAVAASLKRLSQPAAEAPTFRDYARFHLEYLPRLVTQRRHLDQIRQTILNLAVIGKLVPQDPNDELASEPSTVRGAGSTRTVLSEQLFELPKTWKWTRLGLVSELINGDRSKNYPNKAEYVQHGVAWINTGHIEPDGTLSIERMHYITRKKFDTLRSGKIKLGDLVYCLRGATIGKTAIVSQFDEGAVASSLVIIRLSPLVDSRFAYHVLTSPVGRSEIRKFDNGSAQPNLSANSVKKYAFPLPPLAEQRRIVEKVDALVAICDRLEASLATAQTESRHLLKAVLYDALASLSDQRPRINAKTAPASGSTAVCH